MNQVTRRRKRSKQLARWILTALLITTVALRLHPLTSEAAKAASNQSPSSNSSIHKSSSRTTLQVGAYIINISDIDLKGDTFNADLLIWTRWEGTAADNPSSQLTVLNSVASKDRILDAISHENTGGVDWTLYRLNTSIVQRWQLKDYPFDEQTLYIELGFKNPLSSSTITIDERVPPQVSPGLQLDGWVVGDLNAYNSSIRYLSDLGHPVPKNRALTNQQIVSFDINIKRLSRLYLAPDFLGYFLAVGLCSLSLVIIRSRDDLILAAVVSSASNYVFIADKLPVSAMNGFIGSLQVILIIGILYVVAADEIIDQHLKDYTPRVASLLRYGLLPSYLLGTITSIALIIP